MIRPTAFGAFLLGTVSALPAMASINAGDFGLSQSGDNTDALQRAFDVARGSGQEVVIPPGTYSYSRQLTVDGVRVSGSSGTVLTPSDPYNQRITLTGNSPSLSDVYIRYHPVARSGSDHGRNGVWVQDANNFTVSGVTFDGAAYGVPPRGQGAGDLFVYNSTDGTITNNSLSYTWADAIHITGGSNDIDVTNNRVDHSGDDGIAVVNYGDGTGDVGISGNTVTNNLWGRGITAVGSSDVQITNNLISGNEADLAGVYVASEPAYNTDVPRNVLVEGNTIQDTGGAGTGHGQIMLWSGQGALSNVTVRDNEVRNSERSDLAVVVSGPMNGVTVDGNSIDGAITRRNGGSYNDGGNSTSDTSMANSVSVPAGTPPPSGNGSSSTGNSDGGSGTESEMSRIVSSAGNFGSSCAGSGALSSAMAAAGAVVSIWSGGRATAPLQIAQQIQLVAQRICQTEQLAAQIRMLQGMDLRTIQDILAATNRMRGILQQGDFLMTPPAILETMQDAYPQAFPPGTTYEDMEQQQIIWNERTRSALDTSTQIENSVIHEQEAALQRAGAIEQAGRDSGGIRGAQLATNALLTEVMGTLNNQIAVQTAHQRALQEVQYREEAEKAAAKRDAEDFMSKLGECRQCGSRSINLFGGESSGAVTSRTTNDVFGTGVPGN
jgi:parallel beta-helix repeat protein